MSKAKPHIYCGPIVRLRDWRKLKPASLTRGERVVKFIETHCIIPEGELVGQRVRLDVFQKEFIVSIYDNKAITKTAILSIARKNAKTALIAFIMIAHLVGPEAKLNSRIISGAMSREQAAEVFNYASKCLELSDTLRPLVNIIPSTKTIIGLPMAVTYVAISADGKTAHGKSPILAILDEVGQVEGARDDFIDAILTSQGAYENPLRIIISTQASTDADLLSLMIDDARTNKPVKTVCHVYEAPAGCSVLDEDAWRAANPALGKFRSLSDMREQAEQADRMPSFENTFRNLLLNQRVNRVSTFISRSVWEQNAKPSLWLPKLEWYGGLDLSGRTDLTAFVLAARDADNFLHIITTCWTPEHGLIDRSKRDRVPYDLWVKQGHLRTTPGKTVDYDFIATEVAEICSDLNVVNIAFDRWRIDVFRAACERNGILLPLKEFGQGFKDMSPAIDALEADLLNNRVRHGDHPVLTMAAGNAVVIKDPAGGRKLDKSKATGRIDPLVALAMAEGIMSGPVEKAKEFKMLFV